MKNTNIDFIKEPEQLNLMKWIFEKGDGILIELSGAPTATVPLLNPNEKGIYSNDIYWRIGSTIYKFSSDSQITITTDET